MIRVAVIGAGAIAKAYIDVLAGLDDFRLAAVVDVDLARATALAEANGAIALGDYQHLKRGTIDAAIVCTPPDTHRDITCALLEAGIHVLCEKPFALGPASARQMATVARNVARVLTMATKFRFVDDLNAAREMITEGRIGALYRVDNVFASPVDMTGRWNVQPMHSGGGVLIDNGTHSVDILRFLLGPIESVRAVETSRDRQYPDVEDSARIECLSVGGVFGRIELSWRTQTARPWFVSILGSKGQIEVGWKGSRRRLDGAAEFEPFGTGYDKKAAFLAQLRDFAGAVRGEHSTATSLDEAIASVDVVDAAYISLHEDCWTAVGGVIAGAPSLGISVAQ